jgi:hypothetical protein
MVLADNGSSLFMSGAPDPGWNDSDLNALRAVPGSAFEAVDVSSLKVSSTSYAVTGGSPPPPPPPPPPPSPPPPIELVANADFESSLSGWAVGNSRTTVVRTCLAAHGGSCSAELARTRNTGDVVLDDSPDTVASTSAGATYTASAWVLAPAGRMVRLRVRELSGSSVVRSSVKTATADGGWDQLVVTTAAASGGSRLSVEVVASLARGAQARVDDVWLQRG